MCRTRLLGFAKRTVWLSLTHPVGPSTSPILQPLCTNPCPGITHTASPVVKALLWYTGYAALRRTPASRLVDTGHNNRLLVPNSSHTGWLRLRGFEFSKCLGTTSRHSDLVGVMYDWNRVLITSPHDETHCPQAEKLGISKLQASSQK